MLKSILSKINKITKLVLGRLSNKEPWYKYYGDMEKIEYPDLTIYELIEKTANTYPYYIAYEYYGKKVTDKDFLI